MARKKTQREKEQGLVEIKRKVGTSPGGRSIYKSFYGSSKSAAELKYREYLVASAKEKPADISTITFGEWAEKWLATYKENEVRAVTYYETYHGPLKRHILPEFENKLLADILPADIKLFYSKKADYSPSMLSKLRLILNAIFDAALDNKLIASNPAKNVKPPKAAVKTEKQAYTYAQARNVIEFAKGHPYGADIILLLKTGMRRAELLALRWDNVDMQDRIIYVKESVSESAQGLSIERCKTERSIRSIPFDDELYEVLSELKNMQSTKAALTLVSPNSRGGLLSPKNWARRNLSAFMADLSAAYPDIPALTAHELRHSFGSILYERGVDIVTISKLMGHASIDITVKLYVHDNFDIMRAAIKKGV